MNTKLPSNVTAGRMVTVSTHVGRQDAEIAAQQLTACLTVRGENEDYIVTLPGQDRAGRWLVCVRSADAEPIILAVCLEALLRWTSVQLNGV